MPSEIRLWLDRAGGVLALTSVVFVVSRCWEYFEAMDFTQLDSGAWGEVALLAAVYGCAGGFSRRGGDVCLPITANLPLSWVFRVYGRSQLGKYIPGNVFHLAGRQGMAMAAGIPGWVLIKATLFELGLVTLAGVLFSALVVPVVLPWLPVWSGGAAFLVLAACVVFVLSRLYSPAFSFSLCWYGAFLGVAGLLFVLLLVYVLEVSGISFSDWPLLCGAYVVALVVGMVAPGVPAGVGVREVVLLSLLGGMVSEGDLLVAVLMGRVVSVVGDMFFSCGRLLLGTTGKVKLSVFGTRTNEVD